MLSRPTSSAAPRNAFILAIVLDASIAVIGSDTSRTVPAPAAANSHTSTIYEVSVYLDGKIFPVFANYAPLRHVRERHWGTIAVRVSNLAPKPLRNSITVQVPGWSDQEIQLAEFSGSSVQFVAEAEPPFVSANVTKSQTRSELCLASPPPKGRLNLSLNFSSRPTIAA